MSFQLDDTIGALASAPGPAARGIIRLSGPSAVGSVEHFFTPSDRSRWQKTRVASAHPGTWQLAGVRTPLPALVYCWPTGHSYTGQPLAEIHAPGSPPLLEAVLGELFERGIRPAAPGEFTLRAFLSGRIDLVQAEAVLGVIDAVGDSELTTALNQLAGGVSGPLARLRNGLIDLLADLEAGLDFVEEDIRFVTVDEVGRRLAEADGELEKIVDQCRSRMQSTGRSRVVLAGLPNAGKSTLFNALLNRDAALISPAAGTTRDYLCDTANWHGLAVELIDTPGWNECSVVAGADDGSRGHSGDQNAPSGDAIQSAARDLGTRQWQQADLIVWCSASDQGTSERRLDAERLARLRADSRPVLVVRTKADLMRTPRAPGIAVSAVAGIGLEKLVEACVDSLAVPGAGTSGWIGTTAARCRESLFFARSSIASARHAAAASAGDELVAIEIREALDHLGRVLGTVYTDDILDRIFSRFCIGK